MARPPKYASDEDKPVSVTFRIPRDLYDQAQQHAKRRQTTLTELVCEGLQMRLETPTDPRDILATQDSTVMQELRQMIADEVQVALAALGSNAPTSAPRRKPTGKSKTVHSSNATQRFQNKLTPDQRKEVREKRDAGASEEVLMEAYGISRATLYRYLKAS
jgi:DNA invertase Pin-like site-specific DNA recombinase